MHVRTIIALVACLLAAPLAHAQRDTPDQLTRVPVGMRDSVRKLADSVSGAGLPAAVVVDKALEGASKGATIDRIMAAMRRVASDLGTARVALGRSTTDELAAGASALRAGVPADVLAKLRHSMGGRPLVVPLAVIGSLVAEHANPNDALSGVLATAQRGGDATLLAFGQNVARSISAGTRPADAIGASVGGAMADPKMPTPLQPRPKTKP